LILACLGDVVGLGNRRPFDSTRVCRSPRSVGCPPPRSTASDLGLRDRSLDDPSSNAIPLPPTIVALRLSVGFSFPPPAVADSQFPSYLQRKRQAAFFALCFQGYPH